MKLQELLKLRRDLVCEDDVDKIIDFFTAVKFNEKNPDKKFELNFGEVKTACDNLQDILKRCRFAVGDFIPSLEPVDENMVFSVRPPGKPPFIVRTNNPAVIEKIYHIFIKVGGTENVKFLLKNLRLNEDDKK